MTDQSRVEAVARAIDPLAWDELKTSDPALIPTERLLLRIKESQRLAQAAIEASDAWLKEQERVNTTACPRCGTRCDVGDFECRGCGQEVRWWSPWLRRHHTGDDR